MSRTSKFLYFYLPKYHHLFLNGKPNVLVNSIQKAGTHMLTNALAKSLPLKYNERGVYNHTLGRYWDKENADLNTSPESVIAFLADKAWPGEILRGHIEYDALISDYLSRNEIPHILIIRKPLDVLLSLANWWERHNEISVLPFITYKRINEPEKRLEFLLTGNHEGIQIWPNLIDRFKAYEGWLNVKTCLVLRYEDFAKNTNLIADKLEAHLPVSFYKGKFLKELENKNNRTYTNPIEKIHKHLPDYLREKYIELGGEVLEKKWGY